MTRKTAVFLLVGGIALSGGLTAEAATGGRQAATVLICQRAASPWPMYEDYTWPKAPAVVNRWNDRLMAEGWSLARCKS